METRQLTDGSTILECRRDLRNACASSGYQALFLLPLKTLGMRLKVLKLQIWEYIITSGQVTSAN